MNYSHEHLKNNLPAVSKNFFPEQRVLLFIMLVFLAQAVIAQAPPQEWLRTYDGGSGYFDQIKFVRLDAQENIVVTGVAVEGSTYWDVTTVKYTPAGDTLWTHTWNNSTYNFDDQPNDMEIAPNGDIIITGYSKLTDDSWDINSNMFVLAIDQDGDLAWSDSIKGSGYVDQGYYTGRNIGFDIEITDAGDIYVAGQAMGNNVTEYDQMVVAKYNSSGVRQWLTFRDNSTAWGYADFGRGIGLDAHGNAYICGATTLVNTWTDMATWKITSGGNFRYIAIEPGNDNNTGEALNEIITDPQGNSYVFGISSDNVYKLIKYDSLLNEEWVYPFDTIATSISSSFTGADRHMAFDADGNLILAGCMDGKIGVCKFTPSGTPLWIKLVSGTGPYNNEIYRVLTGADNSIYLTGAVSMLGTSYWDIGTFKLDPSGDLSWFIPHAGPGNINDKSHSMAVASDGSVYIGGFGNGYSSSGDYLLIKYNPTLVGVSENKNSFTKQMSVFPNPAAGNCTVFFNSEVVLISLEVFDMQGKLVYHENIQGAKSLNRNVDLSFLESGCYQLKAITEDNSYVSPVIIQK